MIYFIKEYFKAQKGSNLVIENISENIYLENTVFLLIFKKLVIVRDLIPQNISQCKIFLIFFFKFLRKIRFFKCLKKH